MDKIKIGKRSIGKSYPCFVIAEAGVNHNGQIKLAKKLIDAAITAGADAVKFQTFKPEELATKTAGVANYAKRNLGKSIDQLTLLKNVILQYEDFKILKKYCDDKGIIFLSTPHSFDAIDFLDELVPAYKFGSGDITNLPSLEYAAGKHKPMILGTGMATLQDVKEAIRVIKTTGNDQIIALHCTTNYPCPLEEVNLRAMITMQQELDCLVGYSDHTSGITVPIMSTAFGAVILEKHLTLDKNLPGPDHKASLEPDEFTQMVIEIRNAEKALGSFEKKPTSSEKNMMSLVRKSIVANQDIKPGTVISHTMLSFKRPGIGLPPAQMENIIGKKAKHPIAKDEIIRFDMVE